MRETQTRVKLQNMDDIDDNIFLADCQVVGVIEIMYQHIPTAECCSIKEWYARPVSHLPSKKMISLFFEKLDGLEVGSTLRVTG